MRADGGRGEPPGGMRRMARWGSRKYITRRRKADGAGLTRRRLPGGGGHIKLPRTGNTRRYQRVCSQEGLIEGKTRLTAHLQVVPAHHLYTTM